MNVACERTPCDDIERAPFSLRDGVVESILTHVELHEVDSSLKIGPNRMIDR